MLLFDLFKNVFHLKFGFQNTVLSMSEHFNVLDSFMVLSCKNVHNFVLLHIPFISRFYVIFHN